MFDFDALDRSLEALVGVSPDAVLRESATRWADHFQLARKRLCELAQMRQPSTAELLERDRLASFFGCAYGERGFLARAGALHGCQHTLARLERALPQLGGFPQALDVARTNLESMREITDQRLFMPLHADDAPLRNDLSALNDLLRLLASVQHTDRWRQEEASGHALKLRTWLWTRGLECLARGGRSSGLPQVFLLDRALERLRVNLVRHGISRRARRQLAVEGWTLLGRAHVAVARERTQAMLDGALLLIAEGLAAENKPNFRRTTPRPMNRPLPIQRGRMATA